MENIILRGVDKREIKIIRSDGGTSDFVETVNDLLKDGWIIDSSACAVEIPSVTSIYNIYAYTAILYKETYK